VLKLKIYYFFVVVVSARVGCVKHGSRDGSYKTILNLIKISINLDYQYLKWIYKMKIDYI